jgi:MFS family permease
VSLTYLGPTAGLIGAGEGLFIPASFAILPSVLETSQLTAGNGLFAAFQQGGSFLGPAIGGVVVALASPAPAFGIDAASFAISALSLAFIRRRVTAPPSAGTSPPAADTAPPAGGGVPASGGVLRLLRTSPVLQLILVIVIAANLTSAGLGEIALPALAHQRYAASGYGALLCCIAAGSVIGSLIATRSGGLLRPAVAASLVFAGESVAIGVAPFLGGLPGMAAALVLMGLGNGLGNAMMLPRIQAWAPPELMGRLMGLIMLCSFGSAPVSVAITGVFVHHFGAVPFFPIAGSVVGVVVLGALASRQWRAFGSRPAATEEVQATVAS